MLSKGIELLKYRVVLPLLAFVLQLLFPSMRGASAQIVNSAAKAVTNASSPKSLVRPLNEQVTVTRDNTGTYTLNWVPKAAKMELSMSQSIDFKKVRNLATFQSPNEEVTQFSGPVQVIPTKDEIGKRSHFRFVFTGGEMDGRTLFASDRFLPLKGASNFRDLGGYRTSDGREVRWGKIYRANALSGLAVDDLKYLANSGVALKNVCDLRGDSEVKAAPDQRIPNTTTLRLPIDASSASGDPGKMMTALMRGDNAGVKAMMADGYVRMADEQAVTVWGPMLRQFADNKSLPFVFHCTAGKDRTGVAAALLLSLLGVPRETIVADYSLTNSIYDDLLAELKENKAVRAMGMDANQLAGVLVADPVWIEAMLAHIDKKYGSIETYLKSAAKLDDATIAKIRTNLLH